MPRSVSLRPGWKTSEAAPYTMKTSSRADLSKNAPEIGSRWWQVFYCLRLFCHLFFHFHFNSVTLTKYGIWHNFGLEWQDSHDAAAWHLNGILTIIMISKIIMKQSHNHRNVLKLILSNDASCVIVPRCPAPNTTDDFHLRKMRHFRPENLLPERVLWLVQMGTIKDGTANLDSQHQLWMWLLHELQGAFCDRRNVCQTDAAMIRICVWVMLKGCLLTPERFSGSAVATQPNFSSIILIKRASSLLTGGASHVLLLYQYGGILWGHVADLTATISPLLKLSLQMCCQNELNCSDAVGRLTLDSDFTHCHKNKSNKRLITSRWLILCCVIKSPGLTPTSNITPLCSISSYKYHLNPIFLVDLIQFLFFLSDKWSHITAVFAWIWVCQSCLISLLVSS